MLSRPAIVFLLGAALATGGCDRRGGDNGQAEASGGLTTTSPDEAKPAAAGATQPGAIDRSHAGEAAPTSAFTTLDGKPASLADFRGEPVLVNLWATWCAPCIKEMPTLDAAAKTLGGRLPVIAVSQDMEEAKAKAFLADRKLVAVRPYLDPKLGLSLALAANLPTTIRYDAAGKEIWRVTGDRDWASPESLQLLGE